MSLFFSVAIPSIASPGAIMVLVILTDNHLYTIEQHAIITLQVFAVIFLTAMILLIANRVNRMIGEYGITVISKIMGLILASSAVQNIMTGIKSFFMS